LKSEGLEMISKDGTADTADPNVQLSVLNTSGYSLVTNQIRWAGTSVSLTPRDKGSSTGVQFMHFGSTVIRGSCLATKGCNPLPVKDTQDTSLKASMQKIMDKNADNLKARNKSAAASSDTTRAADAYLGVDTSLTAGVNFRSSDELGIDVSFVLYQSEWQKSFEFGSSVESFEENVVRAFTSRAGTPQGSETMPYPGKVAWEDGDHFGVNTGNKYVDENADGSVPKPRTNDAYKEAALPEFENKTLKSNYVVNQPMSAS